MTKQCQLDSAVALSTARLAFACGAATSLLLSGLATATAYAEVPAACNADFLAGMTCTADVVPGLTCNAGGWTTCTNATNTDYTLIETVDCPGGTEVTQVPHYGDEPSDTYYSTDVRTVDPYVENTRIFVAANNSGLGFHGTGCDGDPPTSVRYALEGPPPEAPPAVP